MHLNTEQRQFFQDNGYLTINGAFTDSEMDHAIEEAGKWQQDFVDNMSSDESHWYLDHATKLPEQLRKLDNPVSQKEFFRKLALSPGILELVEGLLGQEAVVFFSQIFFKPPFGGGPKPVHQDNFYFGPDNLDGVLTLWIAFDAATIDNGCLHYGAGTNKYGIIEHYAPGREPYNYQIPVPNHVEMTPAPVAKGGISLHHGCTFHQSSNNTSNRWRRAMAVHYMRKDVKLTAPVFHYDPTRFVKAY